MKTIISTSTQEMVNSFDKQLAIILQADILNYRQENQSNLVDFNTRRFDLELQLILQYDLESYKNVNNKLAHVG